ncbi:membrane protease YdiL (CAAX protease family) [Rhodovulum iodosum]|uniref:Membrane protease YdiL (CAAX protease family) n=2 Tax=Rhodovulum iodosum TaxID=68291 RepID=A0ABV3XQH2_9RHOB
MAPLWAGLVVGAIWGLWHLPAFFLSGTPQSAWGLLPFLAGTVATSVIITGLFNAARGSLLLPVLAHARRNSPLWPDAQPHDSWFFVGLAVLVVGLNLRAFTRCDGAATAVID